MTFSLIIVYVFIAQLEQVLTARSDINAEPFAGMGSRRSGGAAPVGFFRKVVASIEFAMMWVREKLEFWIAPQDDKRVAWTLGIGWACCGGGLAGGCLVFAKASCVGLLLLKGCSDVLACMQSQSHLWQPITRELREPDRPRFDHLYFHLPGHHRGIADCLSEPRPQGVRLDTRCARVLRCVHCCWLPRLVGAPYPVLSTTQYSVLCCRSSMTRSTRTSHGHCSSSSSR